MIAFFLILAVATVICSILGRKRLIYDKKREKQHKLYGFYAVTNPFGFNIYKSKHVPPGTALIFNENILKVEPLPLYNLEFTAEKGAFLRNTIVYNVAGYPIITPPARSIILNGVVS